MRTLRPVVAALLVAALSAFGAIGIASPAAANPIDVLSLQAELDASTGLATVVALDLDISETGTTVTVPSSVTLDLNGRALSLYSLRLSPGVTLRVQDSGTAGSLTTNTSGSTYDASIYTAGATLLLTDGAITATGGAFGAAIGGEHGQDGGTITISGGTVTATSGEWSAAIGGGNQGGAGAITVSGGTVIAEGGRGAAIGTGSAAPGETGSITISGGHVTASTRASTYGAPIGGGAYSTSGPISISGGTVIADASASDGAAAIGAGGHDPGTPGSPASVTISAGTVTATAGGGGAGIGGGSYGYGGTVSILGTANVTAYGTRSGASIGSGYYGLAGSVSIGGSASVTATNHVPASNAAAIGSGSTSTGATDVTITGGTVVASVGDSGADAYGAAIGSGAFSPAGTISISGGTVTATGNQGGAGIGGGTSSDSGTILISGGNVTAATGQYGASIGGGMSGSATSITISGGAVTARGSIRGAGIGGGEGGFAAGTGAGGTIIISGGTVEAHQQYEGAAIGGGHAGAGANVVIGAGAVVTAISDQTYSADPNYTPVSVIGPGVDSSSFGTLSIAGSLVVGTASFLEVPSSSVTTIESTGVVSGAGSVRGFGAATIINHGIISNQSVTVPSVTDHHYVVTFEPNTVDTSSVTTPVHVYATTMDAGLRALPTFVSTHEFLVHAGWSQTTTGPVNFTGSTVLNADRSAYAVWGPPYLEFGPAATIVDAGDSVTYATLGYGFDQTVGGRVELGDFTGKATVTTNDPTATVNGSVVTFGHAGVVTVTATIGAVSTTSVVTVRPGPLHSLAISYTDLVEDRANLVAGNTVEFNVEGFDINGTSRGDYTNLIDVTSTNLDDTLYDGAVYFTKAGARTITVTADDNTSVSKTFAVTVVPAGLESITPEFSGYSITAGVPMSIIVNGSDHYGNALGDVSSQLSYVSSNGESFTGNTVTFEDVGNYIVTISHPTDGNIQSKQVSVEVVAAELDHFVVTATQSTATSGDTVYFTVQGYDAFDNPVGNYNSDATLTSNLAATINGMDVRVGEAGTHTITATLGSVTGTYTVVVSAGDPYRLRITSIDTGPVVAGTTRMFRATAVDEWGNVIADVTANSTFDSYALPDYDLDSTTGATVSYETAGSHVVQAQWTADSNIVGSLGVSVVAAAIDSLQISSTSATVQSGNSLTFVVTAFDVYANPITLAPGDAVLTNALAGETITGLTVTFGEKGSDVITATVGSKTVTTAITVQLGALTSIAANSVLNPIVAGQSSDFFVDGFDAYGNSEDVTALATWSTTSGTFAGDTGTFTLVGTHTVTATIGTLTSDTLELVYPGSVDYIVVASSAAGSVVAGGSRTYSAASYDEYDNLIGDVTANTVFVSSNLDDIDASPSFTFEEAGVRTITATWQNNQAITATVATLVVGNEADPASLAIQASSATPDQYGSITITVTGFDQFGNLLLGLEDNVTITSSVPTDVITGNQISFPHASPHTITVTLGTASASVLVQVRPAAVSLAATGTDSGLTLIAGALLLLFGILVVLFRRRRIRGLTAMI